jgi:hypothetical protein
MEAVLGRGTMERCGSMGKSKWTAWVQLAVDVHYHQHWIRRIEAKLAVSLAETAAPDALVGQVELTVASEGPSTSIHEPAIGGAYRKVGPCGIKVGPADADEDA